MEPIRVLQVFAQMNRGGAETMIMNLYRKIDRTKVQFDFIVHTNDECAFDDEIRNLGGKIYRVPRYTGKNHLSYRKSWKEFFDNHPEYRIVHGHVRSTASIYLKIAKNKGLVTIAHSHNTSSGKGVSAAIKTIFQLQLRYISSYMIGCSETAGIWLFGEKACLSDRFMILNNAIDTEEFKFSKEDRDNTRNELGINDKFVIGNVGRFSPQKNHEFLIEVFNAVFKKDSNTILLLVGDGEKRHEIQETVNSYNLCSNVIFYGVSPEIPKLLSSMDLFLMPSLHEGFPVVLVESQCSDLPCVISSTITKEVLLSDSIKQISLNDDADVWADAILEYKKNQKDRNNDSSRMIREKGYDVEKNARWIENFYLGLT